MGHGDHWEAILGKVDRIADIIPKIVAQGRLVPVTEKPKQDEAAHQSEKSFVGIEYGTDSLCGLSIIQSDSARKKNLLVTAYPFARYGIAHDMEVTAIRANMECCEATLNCIDRNGTEISFFEPFFFMNRHLIEVGGKYEFSIAAIAYSLSKLEDTELIITEGPSIEMERERILKEDPNADVSRVNSVRFDLGELRSFLPHDDAPEDAGFQTVVEDTVYFHFDGIEICRMPVTFNLGDDREVKLNLYASESVLMGYRPRIGDSIRGTLWLQGYAVKAINDAESWAAIDRSDSTVERLKRALAVEDYLSDLPMGVKALGSSMAYSGLEVTSYGNYGQSPDIPAFLVEHQGKAINVWVRSYIEDQEPALSFSDEEKKNFIETSQARGQQGVCVVVVCKDIGSGYTFKILGLEELEELTGHLLMVDYLRKESEVKDDV